MLKISKRFRWLFFLSLICTIQAKQPNIIVILTDDQGWGDLSLNGNKDLSTPNIDSLAHDGAQFDRFFVCPVCSPTRAEFLTGRYHVRGGVYSTSTGGERLDLDELTIADTFKSAGYATGAFGKWHNGMQYPYHPNGRGFDEFYGFCSGHWGDYFNPPLEHNGQIVKGEGFCINDFTDKAIDFIDNSIKEEKPFFAYVPYNTPHSPMQVPDQWWDKFKDKEIKLHNRDPRRENMPHLRCALAMCENIDWNVGRILKKIEDQGIANDTIVVFFHDNGPNGVRWNGGMKGRKGSTDEGGVRSPLLIRWPGHIPKGKFIKPIASAMDLLPTLADCAKIPVTSKKNLDGRSLKPLLLQKDSAWEQRTLINYWKGKTSARTQRFRLDHQGKLFDLINDPGQQIDVSKIQTKVVKELLNEVTEWEKNVLSELGKDNRPFIIGYPGYPWTQIPARDGVAHGGIKRSGRTPNCSYFMNWKSTKDKITWDCEVGSTGTYEVSIHYALPKGDEGTVLELSHNQSKIRYTITESHEVQNRGHENDRVMRRESYVKDFKEIKIGEIKLNKGKGELTLRAMEIPGNTALEFRLMMLKRIQ
ncbi:MAG: sulfatase-like hydrolase/transferase [Verrucomicrobiota bacterium]|nr:sulfatase-like hydrolase/transferase [Verrucomicrobiota bacterium]